LAMPKKSSTKSSKRSDIKDQKARLWRAFS